MKISEQFNRLGDPENWRALPESDRPIPRPRRATGPLLGAAAAGVCAIALAVGILATSSGGSTSAAGHNARVVTWRPVPAHQGAIRLAATKSAPTPCRPDQLKVSTGGGGGAGGTFYVPVHVRNSGADGCTLADRKLSLRWAGSGHSVVDTPRNRVLLPGGTQTYRLGFGGHCVTLPKGTVRQVQVPASLNGTDLPVDTAQVPNIVTGCTTATLTAVEPPDAQDSGTGPFSMLRVSLDIPTQASRGSTLTYTMTLTNEGASVFNFSNCPTYTEMAGSATRQISERTYTLNCAGDRSIAPGTSRTYAMQLPLPAGTGLTKIAWIMDNGPSSNGVVTVH